MNLYKHADSVEYWLTKQILSGARVTCWIQITAVLP